MARSVFPQPRELTGDDRRRLYSAAVDSIERTVRGDPVGGRLQGRQPEGGRLQGGRPQGGRSEGPDRPVAEPSVAALGSLGSLGSSFVTVEHGSALRGCIGTLEPVRPLVEDVTVNAAKAVETDTRFAPVRSDELSKLAVKISVLSEFAPIAFESRADLVESLRPGLDGLLLAAGANRGTFLPSVWSKIPDAAEFVAQLERKAGLSHNDWGAGVSAFRYATVEIGRGA